MREQVKQQKPDSVTVKLAKQCQEDSEKWFGDQPHIVRSIPHHTLALAGEVGEFANLVKKIERGSLSIGDAKVRYALAKELTDVFTYVLNLAALLQIDLEEAYKHVRADNDRRFGEERKGRNGGK